jgi:cyclohexyl-isocyanide hydratase
MGERSVIPPYAWAKHVVGSTGCFFCCDPQKGRRYTVKMAFILFDRMTMLDFVGFYDAIAKLRILKLMDNVTWDLCAMSGEITDELGMTSKAGLVAPDLSSYDLLFVPGGMGTRELRLDGEFVGWLQTAKDVPWKVSVCTGALLLGAAGFLEGKKATTNPNCYDLLAPYCAEVVKRRIVADGTIVTGGGVSASIDLGLYMLERLAGAEAIPRAVQMMDYPYYEIGKFGNG